MPDESNQLGPGTVLADRYELTALIGRGGFGHVYRARQLNMDRDVAIKILPPEFMAIPDVVERFKREARLASRLQHPNTITLHDYGKHADFLFIAMELLHGEDLADLLRREGRLKPKQIVHIARQVLKSLAEAHQNQIIHRDLKPENIFLSVVGDDDEFVKVLDFGIAKLALPDTGQAVAEHRSLTLSGSTVGTPAYMSPEQAAGEELNGQSDLYALGIIMYEMACGRPPFHDKDAVKVMRAHLFEDIPPLSDPTLHGTLLDRVIRKAVDRDKAHRFASAHEFLLALAGEPVARPQVHVQGVDLSSLSEANSAKPRRPDQLPPAPGKVAGVAPPRRAPSSEEPSAGFQQGPSPTQQIEVDASQDALWARGGRERVQQREGQRDGRGEQSDAAGDSVPFGALSADEATESPGRTPSGLTNAPAGYEMAHSSSSSSILTVLEIPADPEDDEVILLTRPKEPTPSARSSAHTSDDALASIAPNTPAPVRATPRGGIAVDEGKSGGARNEWGWGDSPPSADISADFPADLSAERIGDSRARIDALPASSSISLLWWFVLIALFLAAAVFFVVV